MSTSRLSDRLDAADARGYLILKYGQIGYNAWQRECYRRDRPYIFVVLSKKYARIYAELDPTPLPDAAQAIMTYILDEHSSAIKRRRFVGDLCICCDRLSHTGAILAADRLVGMLHPRREVSR